MNKWALNLGIASAVASAIVVGCSSDALIALGPGGGLDIDGGGGFDAGGAPDSNVIDGGARDSGGDGGTKPIEPAKEYAIGGIATGLLGTGMVLRNNSGDDITVNANGVFTFPKKLKTNEFFSVSIKTQPTAPTQACTVEGGKGWVVSSNVTSVIINCNALSYAVAGTISGLAGSGLVLQNNAGEDLNVGANGTFAFPTTLAEGTDYAVTVKTQPTNLAQECTVTQGSGKVATSAIGDITVVCVTKKFSVGGNVSGLAGTGLVLQNDGEDLPIGADGKFTFPTSLDDGSSFAVSVKSHPTSPQQQCVVAGGSGKLAGDNVTTINVNCSTDTFAIAGTVSGLAGTGLVLQNNAGDDLPIAADGTFAFATPIADLAGYSVTVKSDPTSRWQTCSVTNGSGSVAAAAVTNVAISCKTNLYKVKGKVTGLAGTGLVLQNNAGDSKPISADGSFEFSTTVPSGDGYLVSVLTNPEDKHQTCTVAHGTGTIAGADIENVEVTCATNTYLVGGTVTGLAAGNSVVLSTGSDEIAVGANGSFDFGQKIESGKSYAVSVKTNPTTPSQTCSVTGATGTVTGGNIVSVSVSCATDSFTVGGTISGLDGTGLVITNNGRDLPLNANGTFAFPAQTDETAYDVTVKQQPTAKTQTCVVTSGSGNLGGANVTSVQIACTTNTYSVGGTVAGLAAGNDVVLVNNGGDEIAVNANGSFTFPTQIASGQLFNVTVKQQPTTPNQTCTVTGESGTVTASNIAAVNVVCTTNSYTVRATVTGLAGSGLVIQNNGGADISVGSNGNYTFPGQLDGSSYNVTVKTHPSNRWQLCSVSNGAGTLAGGNVVSVAIACQDNTYSVGGNATGLSGSPVVLTLNGGSDLVVSATGTFQFAASIASGSTYAVAVKTQPSNRTCSVASGAGTITNSPITNVSVSCIAYTTVGTVAGVTFYSVPVSGQMTDVNVKNACLAAGLAAPCQGPPGCGFRNNSLCKDVGSADDSCGNPGYKLAVALGCSNPGNCPALTGKYYYMSQTWTSGSSCGAESGSWCSQGSNYSNRNALCVAP